MLLLLLMIREVNGTLARRTRRTDVILPVLLQETTTGLADAYTVTVEPFVAAVTTDHEPVAGRFAFKCALHRSRCEFHEKIG